MAVPARRTDRYSQNFTFGGYEAKHLWGNGAYFGPENQRSIFFGPENQGARYRPETKTSRAQKLGEYHAKKAKRVNKYQNIVILII